MGYYTYFSGDLQITPALTKPEYLRLISIVPFRNSEKVLKHEKADVFNSPVIALNADDERIASEANNVGDWLSFELGPDKISSPDESVKSYTDEGLLPIVANWLADNGHKLDGSISWDGESSDDQGLIYAAHKEGKNLVEFVASQIVNDGPSWNKAVTNVR